jgi:hypothetical protein
MYFNGKLFLKAEYLALFRQPFRLRRWAYVLLFSVLYLFFLALVILGRGLDHIFFPRFRRQPVKAPVFIIAPPRSGTTLVQKLISLDRDRFVHLKMYQTILPCICYQRLLGVVSALDRKLGGPFRRLLAWCEVRWFGGWDEMHKLRLSEPEEDDALFLYAFASEAIFLLFPFVEELWQAGFPDALPPQDRKKLMRYYRSCLQRHLFANGPGKTLLSKATQSSGTLESLLEEFPDANFITIVRHPYESLASHVSLFVPVWQAHSPEIQRDGLVSRAYAKLAIEWYKHLFTFRHRLDPRHYYCIDYRDLQRNPGETIRDLYQHFNWPIKEQHNGELELATSRQREFKSKHQYDLSDFGLSRDWIQAELGEVLDAYGLER